MSDEMPKDNKNLLIQLYLPIDKELEPFICGVNGHATIDYLEDIEKEAIKYKYEIFENGPGDYLFEVSQPAPESGEAGQVFFFKWF